jgi:hypothetical protein
MYIFAVPRLHETRGAFDEIYLVLVTSNAVELADLTMGIVRPLKDSDKP